MARTILQIIPPQQVGVGVSTAYTTPTNRNTVVTRITFTNTTTTDRWVSIWFVPSAGVAQDENKILDEVFVAAGETFSPSDVEGHVLPSGNTIQVQGEIAGALTVIGSGNEVTN